MHLAWGIQNHANVQAVARYLDRFGLPRTEEELQKALTINLDGPAIPILYFAVEQNSPEIVRVLCKAGAQPNQPARMLGNAISEIQVLVYAIISAEYDLSDTTDTVIALLAMGSSPEDVPRDMWEHCVKASTKDTPRNIKSGVSRAGNDRNCSPELREALCRTLNLMQRYALCIAKGTSRPTPREEQVAAAFKIEPLFEIRYHLIGQRAAIEHVIRVITGHVLTCDPTPLVLFFTGPSGHGKTELARRMGDLLSLEMHTVDCTEMRYETDIFGPKKPYHGYEMGAPLNNFLSDHAGEACVVFLDEVEKPDKEVRNAMLKAFEDGFYEERRFNRRIDCSKVIWVLASNLGCEIIQKFWTENLKDVPVEKQKRVSFTSFERSLKQSIIASLGAPFTGRLKSIVPFMPFSLEEQAVTTYKFMRSLWVEVRKPIDTANNRLLRHLFVNYNDDGTLASHRKSQLFCGNRRKISSSCSQSNRMSDKMNDESLPNYEVRLVTIAEGIDEVAVELCGTRETQGPVENIAPV
ncbi:hypothetical protein ACLMJK_006156 [Lecanora helva]